jgi:hypothetical protein
MNWLDRWLCALKGHDWRWPYRDGALMRVRCEGCGRPSRGVLVRYVRLHPDDREELDEMPEGA